MGDSPLYRSNRDKTIVAIHRLTKEYGYPPTQKEIAEYIGVSEAAVKFRLLRAKSEGYVNWGHNKPRTLQVLDAFWEYREQRNKEGKA